MIPDPSARRRSRGTRTAIAAVVAVLAIAAVPLVLLALDGGSDSVDSQRTLIDSDPAAAVRAAVGQTMAAGSYEMDTVSTSTSAPRKVCAPTSFAPGTPPPSLTCTTMPGSVNRFETHGVVNFEP